MNEQAADRIIALVRWARSQPNRSHEVEAVIMWLLDWVHEETGIRIPEPPDGHWIKYVETD